MFQQSCIKFRIVCVGHAGIVNMKRCISEGAYGHDHGIRPSDIDARHVQFPCAACALGKITDKPHPAGHEVDHYKRFLPGQRLEMDNMFVQSTEEGLQGIRGRPYHISVCVRTGYVRAQLIDDRSDQSLFPAIQEDIEFWRHKGLSVQKYVSDNEGAYASQLCHIRLQNISWNPVPPRTHAHVIENKINTIKAKIRATLLGLPYAVDGRLLPYLVTHICVMDSHTVGSKTVPDNGERCTSTRKKMLDSPVGHFYIDVSIDDGK